MRLFYLLTFFCGIFGYSIDSFAAISVSIVDAPEKTLAYAPVRITGVIENVGDFTEAVSLTDSWGFEIGDANEYLPLPSDYQYDVGEHFVVILHPGEKYYISKYLGEWMEPELKEEGVYEVRIVLSGSGRCIPSLLSKPYGLERDLSAPGERAIYKCWRGKVYSQPVKITIENPSSQEDLEVLEFVKSGEAFKLSGTTGIWSQSDPPRINFSRSYEFLLEKYPDNYYTFVAGLYAAPASGISHVILKQILELQPQHPLRRYALFALAMEEIDRDLPPEKAIETELPAAMKNLIQQYRDEAENWKKQKNVKKQH